MGIRAATVRSIFLEAVEHYPPDQRTAYLDRECAGDPALRTEVEILLRAHGEPDGPLDRLDRELARADAYFAVWDTKYTYNFTVWPE